MESITLEVSPIGKQKLMNFLNEFQNNEVKIVWHDPNFEANKKMLHENLKDVENGTAIIYTFEEIDAIMEKTIQKYEGKVY